MNWKKIGWGVLIADAVVLNVLAIVAIVGYFGFIPGISIGKQETVYKDECGDRCRQIVQLETERLVREFDSKQVPATPSGAKVSPTPAVTSAPTPVPKVVTSLPGVRPKVRTVQYVTIPGSGSSRFMSWESLSGTDFYFDKADYPGLTEVYFEATISLINGNGTAYVRLLNASQGTGVDGSEVSINSQTAQVVTSGRLNFWEGKNLIRVQAKTLTADTAVFDYGRLKIVTEN